MAKVNTNSFCSVSTVSSSFFPDTRETIVEVTDNKGRRYTGKAKWNKDCDEFNANEGFRVAYARAIKQIPKENIITKCGGLKNCDWIQIEDKESKQISWGIFINGSILYVINHEPCVVRAFPMTTGENDCVKIITIVRPKNGVDVGSINFIKNGLYNGSTHFTFYTAD